MFRRAGSFAPCRSLASILFPQNGRARWQNDPCLPLLPALHSGCCLSLARLARMRVVKACRRCTHGPDGRDRRDTRAVMLCKSSPLAVWAPHGNADVNGLVSEYQWLLNEAWPPTTALLPRPSNRRCHTPHPAAKLCTDGSRDLALVRRRSRGQGNLRENVDQYMHVTSGMGRNSPAPPKRLNATGRKTSACSAAQMINASQTLK